MPKGVYIKTAEHKKKIGETLRGKKQSEECIRKRVEKLGGKNKGKKRPEEVKRKISEAMKGRSSGMGGRKHTEETRRKISEALKGEFNYRWGAVEKQCECGCGNVFTRKYRAGVDPVPRFIYGHNRKNVRLSEEHRKLLRESLKGNSWNENKKRPEEVKRKISEAMKGRGKGGKRTEGAIRKRTETRRKNNNGEYCSRETKRKTSESVIRYIQENGTISQYGIKGIFYSHKNQKDIRYDSLYELQAYKKLEQDERVKNYDRCRFSIDYTFNNGIHKYIPDIHVMYIDDTEEIIEVKSEYLLHAEEDKNKAKFISAKEYCKKNEMKFNVWTERECS